MGVDVVEMEKEEEKNGSYEKRIFDCTSWVSQDSPE